MALVFALGLVSGASLLELRTSGHALGDIAAAEARPVAVPSNDDASHRALYPVDVVRVIDGDTFEARVPVWPGIAISTRVRLRGIDTAERRAHCAEERAQAEAATRKLEALLGEGEVTIGAVARGKYAGRVIADVATARTADVGAALVTAGLARRYDGGTRAGWCVTASAQ